MAAARWSCHGSTTVVAIGNGAEELCNNALSSCTNHEVGRQLLSLLSLDCGTSEAPDRDRAVPIRRA